MPAWRFLVWGLERADGRGRSDPRRWPSVSCRRAACELFDLQLRRESIGWVVRVFIDRPGPVGTPEDSVSIEDCAAVSREISAILDVEDPLRSRVHPRGVVARARSSAARRGRYRRFAGPLGEDRGREPRSTARRTSRGASRAWTTTWCCSCAEGNKAPAAPLGVDHARETRRGVLGYPRR